MRPIHLQALQMASRRLLWPSNCAHGDDGRLAFRLNDPIAARCGPLPRRLASATIYWDLCVPFWKRLVTGQVSRRFRTALLVLIPALFKWRLAGRASDFL